MADLIEPGDVPEWIVANIAAVTAWMKERGHESWVVNGIGPVPERIVLRGKATDPNWWFIAERQEQVFQNKLPVYATLDPIKPDNCGGVPRRHEPEPPTQ